MKKLKKIFILSLVLIQIALSSICFSGCVSKIQFYQNEYFIYSKGEVDNKEVIEIYGLTDLGKEQKYLVIPKTIDGIPVFSIGCRFGIHKTVDREYGEGHSNFQSDIIEKIFIAEGITILSPAFMSSYINCFDNCPNLKKVFYLCSTKCSCSCNHTQKTYDCYFAGYTANVSYLYNYDNAPNNNYYWIDSYYNTVIEYIPQNPVRDGYVFDGWYKEAECLTPWNFDTDVVSLQYDENGIYNYNETRLYAKWIKC